MSLTLRGQPVTQCFFIAVRNCCSWQDWRAAFQEDSEWHAPLIEPVRRRFEGSPLARVRDRVKTRSMRLDGIALQVPRGVRICECISRVFRLI